MDPTLSDDPLRPSPGFLMRVTAHPDFAECGVIGGATPGGHWFVVDPQRHPLRVWRRRPGFSYAGTASRCGAAVFSNGPMMGRRLPIAGKLTRARAGLVLAGATATAGLGCAALARGRRRPFGPLLLGGAIGAIVAYGSTFHRWIPCGTVRSSGSEFEDTRDFDGEGSRHAWFGRAGEAFASYAIGDGDLPAEMAEGTGGLILLIRDHEIVGGGPGQPGYRRDFHELAGKRGVVAWGLADLAPPGPPGVLIVLAGRGLTAAQAAAGLRAAGARDAIATDQSGAVMLGSGCVQSLRRPAPPRQSMQTYGLACG